MFGFGMHTRGKGLVVNDGAVQQDTETTEEDANSGDNNEEASQCNDDEVVEEKSSFSSRPGSSNRSRRTPTPSRNSGTISPVLGQTRSSRSATRKGQFVSKISTEDTPLSQRHAETTETKSKRLTLFKQQEPLLEEQSPQHLDETKSSSSEEKDQNKSKDNNQSFVEESEAEKQENVRRSTRPRFIKYGTYNLNDSWITSHKPAKGYPTIKEETNGIVRSSKRHSARRHQYVDDNDEDEEEEDDIDDRCRQREPRKLAKRKGKTVRSSSSKYSTHRSSQETRRAKSAVTYSEYGSTVTNAKKTPAKRQSSYELRRRYQHESSESSDSMTQSSSEEENEEEQVAASPTKESRKAKPVNQSTEAEGQEEQNLSEHGVEMVKGQYALRKRPPVARFGTEVKGSRSNTPPRSRVNRYSERIRVPCSPAHRPIRKRRQQAQNESTTSSSSSDEERFERRKNKSMVKARNRCLPMNFTPDDLGQGVVKDRMKIGSSLADVDPMKIDQNVNFEQVGGLETYIRSLKEMILFPLLYPEVFQKFSIQAPRGVLFYGPPGTGKTLVARCLANECSQKDRRVAFFMRKGADCLSKWVGESERQLRLLFDQAFQMRPSIIFFDEIDGLAPVRSTRQDQIHSSIVSTLLALMDGLDSRGEVIIIGATNRLDAIDPALRRPGRFDREFHFPLPSMPARKEILDIHLKSWNPSPPSDLVEYLSQKTVGYCGADLKALCAEAALLALRRRYPQVYESKDKLLLDMAQINVDRRDFDRAIQRLVPASQRSSTASGKPLSAAVSPLLSSILNDLIQKTRVIFAEGVATLKLKGPLSGVLKQTSNQLFPRLLVLGDSCSHTASALLHFMERLPVHRLDLSTLNGLSVRSPEEACVQLFQEARRNVPAVIYLPLVNRWWPVVGETVRATLLTQLTELDAELPILLLATDETSDWDSLPDDLRELFHEEDGEVFHTRPFTDEERRNFFKPLLLEKCLKPPTVKKPSNVKLEVLPLAPAPPPRQLNTVEKERLERKEEATLRELRIFLREILAKMARNKLFFIFTRPVDLEEVPDYLNIIRQPMDLETMMTKIDQHLYESAKDFLADIELICSNALEYNPDRKPEDKQIRHRACTLRDTAYALIKAEMDTDFEEQCQEISRTRKAREGKVVPISTACTSGPAQEAGTTPLDGEAKPINGEATKSEIRSAVKKRKTTSSWANGNTKKPVSKKRKICETTEQLNGSLTSNESILANPFMETSEVIATGDAAQNPLDDASIVKEDGELEKVAEVGEEEDEKEQIEEATDNLDSDQAIEVEINASSADNAIAISKKKTVSIDVERLEKLLDSFASATENWRLEKLLRLYSKLARLVDRYSKLYDRVPLIQEMEQMVIRLNVT